MSTATAKPKSGKKILWFVFVILCIMIGLYPIGYFFIPDTEGLLSSKPADLLSNKFWRITFYIHLGFGGIALLSGWPQFSKTIREKRLALHRMLGKIYVVAVCISALAGIYIGFYATGGLVSALGFVSLGVIWFSTTMMAYYYALNRDLTSHQRFMTYSYAACFGAVTLRLWLPGLIALTGEFETAYQFVAWLCWVPNLIIATYLNRKRVTI